MRSVFIGSTLLFALVSSALADIGPVPIDPHLVAATGGDATPIGDGLTVQLSAEGGGNCEDTKPGETIEIGRVTIVAPLNVPSLLGEDASALYAKNQFNLIALMMKDNIITIDWNDEILVKTALTHAGKLQNDEAKPSAKAA